MKKPKVPQDEKSRLDALHALNILDTEAEERFDRLTRMAKRLFNVPIALVSLVDSNRQWFKSCQGLNASETPRDISFCGHAILGDEPFVITNTLEDDRFSDNPLVTGPPDIRFYAGCPLKTLNESRIGTLCIIDTKPRNFPKEDLSALQDLSKMVEKELEGIQLSTLDELTNISNRRGFKLLTQQGIKLCARQNLPASLVYFDLNKFKPINDTYGHAEGDRVLRFFAEKMREVFRESDICARLGGDEFAVFLINADKSTSASIVNRLCASIDNYNQSANRGYNLSFSSGISEFDPQKHDAIENLIVEADDAMYKIKNHFHQSSAENEPCL